MLTLHEKTYLQTAFQIQLTACLSILALSPLTFVHSETSALFNVKIAHNIPKSQVEQVEIEMRNTQDGGGGCLL